MSYYCRYKTIMVKVAPTMVIELARDGCNNDDNGRTDNDWRWTLWDVGDLLADINHEKSISEYDHECKVLGKMKSYKELGEHRERMLTRALTWEEFTSHYIWGFRDCWGVEILSPASKAGTYTMKQLCEKEYGFLDGCRYKILSDPLEEKDDIVKFLLNVRNGVDGQHIHKRRYPK